MAYHPIPPGAPPASDAIRALLEDLAGRKELRLPGPLTPGRTVAGFGAEAVPALGGLRLHGAQQRTRALVDRHTHLRRVALVWKTGRGKSVTAIAIANDRALQFQARAALGETPPSIYAVSFTIRETVQEELITHPEFGFVSHADVAELRRLRVQAAAAGEGSSEARQLSGLVGALRRRTTDRSRGGYYRFYGYKEFANRLFGITRLGVAKGFVAAFSTEDYGAQIAAAVEAGLLEINTELIEDLRGGVLIADEIQNTYNMKERNNYGVAIQYVLDVLGDDVTALFLSYTPVTGKAEEVVDFLNYLVPRSELPGGAPLRRADFFEPSGGVSRLRPGALERIGRLSAGRVSFLLDPDVGQYPRRIFEGVAVPGVPYLRFTLCPMSPFHEATLARELEGRPRDSGLSAGAHALYDIAFPNPASEEYGLYRSEEVVSRLAGASAEWRAEAGVELLRGGDVGLPAGTTVVSGPFLEIRSVRRYSTKVLRAVEIVLEAIRAGPAKIMLYAHRVRGAGVLLYQEALRMNGLVDESTPPADDTICSICGVGRRAHAPGGRPASQVTPENWREPHAYHPARFAVAHGDVDRPVMMRSISRYNTDPYGVSVRTIIGSKIIREAFNFRGVLLLVVTSLPVDFPTFLQVLGRSVRNFSHADLPPELRHVVVTILVSSYADGTLSPELRRYADKGAEYLVIQQVDTVIRAHAVDAFANYEGARAALGPEGAAPGSDPAGLDGLAYRPLLAHPPPPPARWPASYEAFGHAGREVATLAAACRALFAARPVWTYADLWAALRGGAVGALYADPALLDEGYFALALESLARPAGEPPVAVVPAGRFYVAARAEPAGAALDMESYLREGPARALAAPPPVTVRLTAYLRDSRAGQAYAVHLRGLNAHLASGASPDLLILGFDAAFHYEVLRRLVEGLRVSDDDARLCDVYRRFRVGVCASYGSARAASRGSAARGGAARGSAGPAPDALVGYVTATAVMMYDGAWRSESHSDHGIGRRHRENDVVVGIVAPPSAPGSAAPLKLRPPLQVLAKASAVRADARTLSRGAVCETQPRATLEGYVRRLKALAPAGAVPDCPGCAKSPTFLCASLRLYLLALEAEARAPANGLTEGVRWLYLFNDRSPSVSALVTRRAHGGAGPAHGGAGPARPQHRDWRQRLAQI